MQRPPPPRLLRKPPTRCWQAWMAARRAELLAAAGAAPLDMAELLGDLRAELAPLVKAVADSGVIVDEGSVVSMGVYIGQSTRIYDRATGETLYGRVPAGSVVVATWAS